MAKGGAGIQSPGWCSNNSSQEEQVTEFRVGSCLAYGTLASVSKLLQIRQPIGGNVQTSSAVNQNEWFVTLGLQLTGCTQNA